MNAPETIQRLHAAFAARAARARRDLHAARALREDLRRVRQREVAHAQAEAFRVFLTDMGEVLEAQRARVKEMRPSVRLVRAMLEKAERRERATAAREMLRAAPLSMLLDMAREANRQHDIGTLAGVAQVLDQRAEALDFDDPAVTALRAEIERWALPDYTEARAALLLSQGLAARARVAGPWQDVHAQLLRAPEESVQAFRAALAVEREAIEATPYAMAHLEALLGGVPVPADATPTAGDYDPLEGAEAIEEATLGSLPTTTLGAHAAA